MNFQDDAPIAILFTDLQYNIQYANSAACILLRNAPENLINQNLTSLICSSNTDSFHAIFDDPESNPVAEGNIQTANHPSIPVRLSVSHQEEKLCWYVENRQEILHLKNKIESLRALPQEYGHDINNLLTVILSATQMIQFDTEESNPIHEDLHDIIVASNRAAAKTRLFMHLGRKLVIKQESFNIDKLIHDITPILRDVLGRDTPFKIDLQASNAILHAPFVSVQASILHLFAHARITKPNSCFVLETRLQYIDGLFASHAIGLANGNYAIVTLREDNFPMNDMILNKDDYFAPDEGDELCLAWENVSRSKGSIVQRLDNHKNFCISLYFPDITDFLQMETE